MPTVAYLGDCNAESIDLHPAVRNAQVLIVEVTFVGHDPGREAAERLRHTHLDDFVARVESFTNELVIVGHLSGRYRTEEVVAAFGWQASPELQKRLLLWL